MASAIEDEFWIFGYGLTSPDNHNLPEMLTKDRSLIWKPPPHYGTLPHQPDEEEYIDDLADKRLPGYIKGYIRRFWQVCALNEKIFGESTTS